MTADEILIKYGEAIQEDWGVTPLLDPIAYRGSNLVRILKNSAVSVADIRAAFDAFIQRGNIQALEGDLLTAAAGLYGATRKTGTHSKAFIVVTGEYCAVLSAGSEYTDSSGGIWTLENEVNLITRGAGCSFGSGVVCSNDPGSFTLREGELAFDTSTSPGIYQSTNGAMIEVGGEIETDEQLRNRLLNRGVWWNLKGTTDAALDAVYLVDGVNFARYLNVNDCDCSGSMFVVSGGDDAEICNAIKLNAGLACSLVGNVECSGCDDIRFQRPCPVRLKINVYIRCDCTTESEESIKNSIYSTAYDIALTTKINSKTLSKLSDDIDYVTIADERMPLLACPDDAEIITDAFGNEIKWGTSDPHLLCGGKTLCDPVYKSSVSLHEYEYPVFTLDDINVIRNCPELSNDTCNECAD